MHLHILWKDKTKVCQKGYIMLHLEKVNGKNIWDILKLQVSETQKSFVAANDISIIEAYITILISPIWSIYAYGLSRSGAKRPGPTLRIVKARMLFAPPT